VLETPLGEKSNQQLVECCPDTHRPNKNAKGMLSLPPDAVMIALDTSGPMKADVFPIWYPV